MAGSWTLRVAAAFVVVVSVVGLFDAVVDAAWDHVVLFGMLIALGAVAFGVAHARSNAVVLRSDLARWLRTRAELSGEPPERIADRAVAAYRDGLAVEPDDELGAARRP